MEPVAILAGCTAWRFDNTGGSALIGAFSLALTVSFSRMTDTEDENFEALVRIAAPLSPDQLEQFLLLVAPVTGTKLLQQLKQDGNLESSLKGTPTIVDEGLAQSQPTSNTSDFNLSSDVQGGSPRLPATVTIGPGEEEEEEEETRSPTSEPDLLTGVSLVKLHARGAFGEVFVGHDKRLSREIAVKRLRPDLPFNERRAYRFIREAEITAKLQHPGIVPIYNLNLKGSSASYTMPLVSGKTLRELVIETHEQIGPRTTREEWKLKIRPLLNHFIAACHAIAYAHSHDVIHRDIKPANIIIGEQGQTLVLDWGCAKEAGEVEEAGDPAEVMPEELAEILGEGFTSQMTVTGAVLGTVQFMSPEQAAGNQENVGPKSDIFGLGATLFNLVTNDFSVEASGTESEEVSDVLEQVKQSEFRKIEEVTSQVPPALAAICHQAMAVKPDDRYATADDLARDIDAYLAGEPVSAYKEPWTDKATRFVRHHRTAFTTVLGALLVGFVSLALLSLVINEQATTLAGKNNELENLNIQLERSVKAEQKMVAGALVREEQGKQKLYETQMLLASEASSEPGGFGRMQQLIGQWNDQQYEPIRGWEWRHLSALGESELWKVGLDATANKVFFTRHAQYARVFDVGLAKMFKIDADGKRVLEQIDLPKGVTAADYNHDQSLVALGFRDGSVKVYDTTQMESSPIELEELKSAVSDVCWNVGGDMLATCCASGEVAVWQWYDRKVVGTGTGAVDQTRKRLLNWSYDGKRVSWTTGKDIKELTIKSGKEKVITSDDWILSPCWSHEGKFLAYIGPDNSIVVYNPTTEKTIIFTEHQLFVESLCWHPSKNYLLSASSDGTVRIWNTDTEKQARLLLGHSGHVYSAAWSPDGSKVVSGGLPEDSLRVWDLSTLGSLAFERELQDRPALAWHPDGKQLAVAERADILIQNDLSETRWIRSKDPKPVNICGIDIDATGKQIACVSRSGRIWTVDLVSGEIGKVYDTGQEENLFPEITSKAVAWSPDGKFLAGAGETLKVWDLATGKNVATDLAEYYKPLVVSWKKKTDGGESLLACAGVDDSIFVFDPVKRKVVTQFEQQGWKTGLDWSPEGDQLAVANRRNIAIWDISSANRPKLIDECEGPSAMVLDLSWSSTQDRIGAVVEDGKVCIWNAKTWAYSAHFGAHERPPYAIQWSPDGKRLVSTARHGRIVFQDMEN